MKQRQSDFNQIKSDVKALLESAISAFEFVEAVGWFNDNVFDGTMTLHEAKSLIRVIGGMEPNHANCSVIQSCLTRVSNRCQILGLEVLAYEANRLLDRLDALADESDDHSTSCVHADSPRSSAVVG
jgi:hypothetical protein